MMDNAAVRILVVDDDSDVLAATSRLIGGAGYVVREASDGLSALECAREWQPDLLLLDVDLPDISGVEVCRQIKADPALKHMFVVLVSATRINSDDQSLGLEMGADGYIAQPIANREFLARVRAYVRLQQAESALRVNQAKLMAALEEKDRLVEDLQRALSEVRSLRGLLPICAHCKKVRDDQGYWNRVETYLAKHSQIRFTHSLCPECIPKFFPDEDGPDLDTAHEQE